MAEHEHHGPSTKNYIMIFVALAILTTMTVLISYTSLGAGTKAFLAFSIASIKALLVALIFMNLRFEPRTIIIFAVSPIVLAIWFIMAIRPDIG